MANGITGSGGVDTSSLDGLLQRLEDILTTQDKINSTNIKLKADDSEIKQVKKSVDDLWKEARESQRTKLELWDTKSVQKEINGITAKLEQLIKGFDISKISAENISSTEKDFLKLYATLQQYSNKFGQEISSSYKNVFDSIFNKSDMFKQDYLNEYLSKFNKQASDALNKNMQNINFEANEAYVKRQLEALQQERAEALATSKAYQEAEKQKREALLSTRDAMVKGLETSLSELKSKAGSDEYLNIDFDSFARFQQQAYDLINTMSQMGIEVENVENLLQSIGEKVYIPKDDLANFRNSFNGVGDKVNEVNNEVNELQTSLSHGVDIAEFEKLQQELTQAYLHINQLSNSLNTYRNIAERSYSFDEFEDLAAKTYEYSSALDETRAKLDALQKEYDILKQSENISEINNTPDTSKIFDQSKLSTYVTLLQEIKQTLQDISSVLGTVNENNTFTNLISSVEILLSKLDEMYQKIGTGTYNIQVNQGIDKTAHNQNAATEDYLRSTMSRYKNAYSKITDTAGGEEKLFAYINNAIDFKGGLDQLYKTYSATSVSEIESSEGQIYRLMDFFKVLRQAMDTDLFGLDLSGIKIPSSNDQNFRAQLRKKSGVNQKNEDLLDLDNDSKNLEKIAEKLSEIRDIIFDISQKDLFGDSFEKLSIQLDGIVEKIKTITSNVNVVNDKPIETTDWGVEYSIDKTRDDLKTATEAQKEFNETIKQGQDISIVQNQDDIKDATDAIKAEGEAAEQAAVLKQKFAEANKEVASSAEITADKTQDAADAIKAEGEASKNIPDKSKKPKEYDEQTAIKGAQLIEAELSKQAQNLDIDGYITSIQRMYDSHENLAQALITAEKTVQDSTGELVKQTQKLNIKYDKNGGIAYTSTMEADNYKATANAAEKERRALEKERQATYKQMQKETSNRQNEEEVQRQNEINNLLIKQATAYKNVLGIRTQIAKLDPQKNSEQIQELEKQKKDQLEIYANTTRQLKAIDENANAEAQVNQLLEMRKKSIAEINALQAKQADKQYKDYQNDITKSLGQIDNLSAKGDYTLKFSSELNEIRDTLVKLQGLKIDAVTDEELAELKAAQRQLEQLVRTANAAENKTANENTINKSLGRINDILSKNTRLSFRNTDVYRDFVALQDAFKNFNTDRPQSELNELVKALNRTDAEFKGLDDSVKGTGFFGDFIHRLSDMNAKFLATYFSFQDIVRYARSAFNAVQDLNKQMVELAKVSDQSLSQIQGDFSDYAKTAKGLGATISDTISATADWARFNKIDPLYGNI